LLDNAFLASGYHGMKMMLLVSQNSNSSSFINQGFPTNLFRYCRG
jgi:hypothetical protein